MKKERIACLIIPLLISSMSNTLFAAECHSQNSLHFFNSISGYLDIQLDQPTKAMANLPGNAIATPQSNIVSVQLKPTTYRNDTQTFHKLTKKELSQPAYHSADIVLISESGEKMKHLAPNRKFFTVSDLLKAVEHTERQTRKNTEWFGGIDVHHNYFEGISCVENRTWYISWGS